MSPLSPPQSFQDPEGVFDIAQIQSLRRRQSYRHEAFLWRDTEDFLAGMVPFVEEGLAAGEAVMVAVISERSEPMRSALGKDAHRVQFVDMAELGRNPARIIPGWQRFLDSRGGRRRPVRGIGEPIWAGRRPEEIVECQLHEALLNVAVDPATPFWLVCPYDANQLGADVIEEAHRSHPAITDAENYRGSTLYGGRAHVDAVYGSDLPDLPGEPDELTFDRQELQKILLFVALRAYTAGVPADKAADLAVAIYQLATSSLDRGAASGTVAVWRRSDAVICEVRDTTVINDPLAGRRLSAPEERKGLWFANQLCDLVQLRSTGAGTTVRVFHWI